ncbi:MAG: hypothetical protein JXA03_06650 [Bacteroidales bacterium]|nr:hypothetical protein [Bacteroidales bacterium]
MKKLITVSTLILSTLLNIEVSRSQEGYCLDFDGIDDYVALPAYYSANGQIQALTLCGWVRLYGDGGGWSVIDFDRSEYFHLEIGGSSRNTGVVGFATAGSDGVIHDMTGSVNIRDGNWHFICGVFDGADKKIYVDGILDADSLNPHGGLPLGTGVTRYGIIGDGSEATYFNGARNNNYFDGLIDNVSVWNIALTPVQIADIMQNGISSPGSQTGLMLYYEFNTGSGQTLTDSGPYGYQGQLGSSYNPDNADPYWLPAGDEVNEFTFDFNGSDDYGLLLNSADINTGGPYANRTIEVWFFAKNIGKTTPQVIYEEGGATRGFNIYIQSGTLYAGGWNQTETSWAGTYLSTGAISSQRWHHVVLSLQNATSVLQPDKLKAFLDGNEFGSGMGTLVYAHSADICIGRNGSTRFHTGNDNSEGEYFEGYIDELRIWNSARSVNQIRQNIHRKLVTPASQSNLVCYIDFNETNGRFAWDKSASGNPAKLLNIAYSDWVASTAPIPYISIQNGNWNNTVTWASGQYYPLNDWARVNITHTVTVTTEETLLELNILAAGSVHIAPVSFLTVSGTLTNQAGNAGLIIESDASGTGSLIHNTPSVSGAVEQYLSEERWHYISSPVSNALSGVYTDIYLIDWSEPDSLWNFIVPVNIPLNVARGYGAWASAGITGTTTVEFRGLLNSGDKAAPVTFSNGAGEGHGWNFVGNPFPSSLEWNTNWTTANIDATAYFWNGIQYLTWNRLTEIGTAPSGEIPVTQGFFVKANAASPSLTMPQSARIHSYQPFYKSSMGNLHLSLVLNGNGYSDEMILCEYPGAGGGFDSDFDAYELGGITECPQIYSLAEGNRLTVNALAGFEAGMVVPVGFEAGVAGRYIISFAGSEAIPDYLDVFFEDMELNKLINIKLVSQYGFFTPAGAHNGRFRILFENNAESGEKAAGIMAGIKIFTDENGIRVISDEELSGTVEVYSILGQLILSQEFNSFCTIQAGVLQPDSYCLVKVTTHGKVTTQKVFIR